LHPPHLNIAVLLALALSACASAPARTPGPPKIEVLVVTGGHGFKAQPFFRMFDEDPDIHYVTAQQDKSAEAYDRADLDGFDVVVLYDSPSKITESQRARFLALFKRGAGLVVMHHALLSYQDWAAYEHIAGGKYAIDDTRVADMVIPGSDCAKAPGQKGCQPDVTIPVTVLAPAHPTTAGLVPFTLVDELYLGLHMGEDITPLLGTKDEVVAWARQEGKSRVVSTILGHGPPAYENPSFVRFLRQTIRWVAPGTR
jgi:type 1 glutamine amidotransferase